MLTSALSKSTPFIEPRDAITLAEAVVDAVRDPLVVLDQDLRIITAGRSFYQTFQLDRDAVRGRLLYEIDAGQWDIPELRRLLKKLTHDQVTMEGYEVDREFPAAGRRQMILSARKVFYQQGDRATVLLAFEDITVRRVREQQIQDLLREKDLLLEEMQHRVANSLQIIASILAIKARTVQSQETRLQLLDVHQRVLSVATIQKHLHLSRPDQPIEVARYLTKLCETLTQSMIGDSRPISLRIDADINVVSSRDAVSLGLIVTELVTNALKHAFPNDKSGTAIVVSYGVGETGWKLAVSDNGTGKSNTDASKRGLGTSLIQALARQLDARVDTASDRGGTAVSITHATVKATPLSTMEAESASDAVAMAPQ